jgi:hypothetical protein
MEVGDPQVAPARAYEHVLPDLVENVPAIVVVTWAWIGVGLLAEDDDDRGQHHPLIRRNPSAGELAYLRCYSPHRVPLPTLVCVAAQRWRIEESFQTGKELTGLDQHQVQPTTPRSTSYTTSRDATARDPDCSREGCR